MPFADLVHEVLIHILFSCLLISVIVLKQRSVIMYLFANNDSSVWLDKLIFLMGAQTNQCSQRTHNCKQDCQCPSAVHS